VIRPGKPFGSSLSGTTENVNSVRSDSAFKTPHICAGDTLLQQAKHRNRNSMPGCAQAVEDGNSLWKLQEKRKKIRDSEMPAALTRAKYIFEPTCPRSLEERSRIVRCFSSRAPTTAPSHCIRSREKQPEQNQHNRNGQLHTNSESKTF
jgi:hypothetical protein